MPDTRRDISFVINGKDVSAPAFRSAEANARRYVTGLKKLFGGIGAASGLAGDLFGASTAGGKLAGAVGGVAGQAALGGMAAGPWGAIAFGGVAVVSEVRKAIKESKEEAELRLKVTQQNLKLIRESQRIRVGETREMGLQALPQATITRMNPADAIRDRIESARAETTRLSSIIASNWVSSPETMASLDKAHAEVVAGEKELFRIQTATAVGNLLSPAGAGLTRGGRGLSQLISGGINRLGAASRGPLKFLQNLQTQLQLEESLNSPAQGFQQRLNDLERMRREGVISPDLFKRAREDVLMDVRRSLPHRDTPSLSVTEARFLTRGRDSQREPLRELVKLAEKEQADIAGIRKLLEREENNQNLEVTLK